MKDTLVKATAADGAIRLLAINVTQSTNEAQKRHSLSFLTTVLIGRSMSSALLLASSMKVKEGRVTLRIQSDGPLKGLFVDAGKDGTVRGYVGNPKLELDLTKKENSKPYFDFNKACGKGYLHVAKDHGTGQPFSSTVELIEGGIGEDIASYLLHSEQTQSAVFVGEKIEKNNLVVSGALIAQIMPKGEANNSLLNLLNNECRNISNFSEHLYNSRNNFDQIFVNLFPTLKTTGVNILEINRNIKFNCKCSLEKSIAALRLLGKKELVEILKEDKKSELTCKFCNSVYQINQEQLEVLISNL